MRCADYRANRRIAVLPDSAFAPLFHQTAHYFVHGLTVFQNQVLNFRTRRVGRLDKDSVGLLIITDDGELAHSLMSPKKHVDKCYFARCAGEVPASAIQAFREGVELPDGLSCLPAALEILGVSEEEGKTVTEINLTIREGKFHQVKRMMEAVGCPVLYLKRMTMGPLTLDDTLAPGDYRPLTEKELESLKQV